MTTTNRTAIYIYSLKNIFIWFHRLQSKLTNFEKEYRYRKINSGKSPVLRAVDMTWLAIFQRVQISYVISTIVLCTSFTIIEYSFAAEGEMTGNDKFIKKLAKLSEMRTQAESRVRLLSGLYKDGEVDKTPFQRSQLLYEDARSAFNAWLDAVKAEFSTKESDSPGESTSYLLESGSTKTEKFLSYADGLILGEPRGGVAEAAIELTSKVIDTGVSIWNELRSSDKDRRKQLLSQLEELRWVSFSDIEK